MYRYDKPFYIKTKHRKKGMTINYHASAIRVCDFCIKCD